MRSSCGQEENDAGVYLIADERTGQQYLRFASMAMQGETCPGRG
jgi:hypothetical protein